MYVLPYFYKTMDVGKTKLKLIKSFSSAIFKETWGKKVLLPKVLFLYVADRVGPGVLTWAQSFKENDKKKEFYLTSVGDSLNFL